VTGGAPRKPGVSLVCRDLAVTPPGASHPVVRDLSLTIAAGEWLAIAGENGGGKTSLALALAGLWPASAGEVTLDGIVLGPDSPVRARIACVLQDPGSQLLQPTVAEEIGFALQNLSSDAPRIERAVRSAADTFGLTDDLASDPRTLSAGRQQLVLIAAAAALEPALLIADEPTAHLDPETRVRVLAWLDRSLANGLAACWVTQDLDELSRAHRVVRLGPESPIEPSAGPPVITGAPLVRVEVAARATGSGPRVRRDSPLSFTIADRGVTALLGPNGAGKSVLLGALAGLALPDQVTLTWERALAAPPILTLQYPELQVFEERVEDELLYAARVRGREPGETRREVETLLARLGFDPGALAIRRTWELSTGEKRVVETVAALVAPAGMILLDEPTAGLDARRREGLARVIRERAGSVPVVVASQDRGWLETLGAMRVEVAGPAPAR